MEYNAHTSIVRTWISQKKLPIKRLNLFFKNNFTRIKHCKFIHHTSHLKTLSQLPSMYNARGIFQHHFSCKKCTLYLIKYSMPKPLILIKAVRWQAKAEPDCLVSPASHPLNMLLSLGASLLLLCWLHLSSTFYHMLCGNVIKLFRT
jgi:hypothetical protein